MNAAIDVLRPAPLRARVSAWLVDTLILLYVGWGLHVLIAQLERTAMDEGLPTMSAFARRALWIGAPLVAYLWGALLPTIGQRIYELALTDERGAPPAFAQRLARAFGRRGDSVLATAAEVAMLRPPGPRPWYRDPAGIASLAVMLLTVWLGWIQAEVRIVELLDRENLAKLGEFVAGFADPDWRVLGPAIEKMVETIFLALMATLFAIPVAGVLAFLAARNVMPETLLGNTVYYVSRTFFTFVRSTEPIVWAIVFCAWVGIGPFAGTLALFVHSVASLVKLYSEAIEQVDPGPTEALRAVGAGPVATLVRAVVPQVVPPFVAFTMYRWDINVRMATILGMVGAGGIGLMLLQNSNLLRWGAVAVIILCITAVVLAMDLASAWIRQRIR